MQPFSHPWNPKSEISGTLMGRLLGLKRTGVNFAKVPPGKELFVYHSHYCEEEWIYLLSPGKMLQQGINFLEDGAKLLKGNRGDRVIGEFYYLDPNTKCLNRIPSRC